MSDIAQRWRRVGDGFTAVAERVPADRWDDPSPCDGWVAHDVVDHLVEWVPPFLAAGSDVEVPDLAGMDRVAAWKALDGAVQAALDDPEVASSTFEHPMAGTHRLDAALSDFICSDVLVHTWDLATSVGETVELDPEAVATYLTGMAQVDEAMLVASGHYGPRVAVPDDAPDQDRLLALTGRTP
jgi:uncharacterized protein (TIGR03086 family)